MLLEEILRTNLSSLTADTVCPIFFKGKGIIYHVIAYDPKNEKNVRKLYFGCHGNRFLKFKVIFRNNPEISKDCLEYFH